MQYFKEFTYNINLENIENKIYLNDDYIENNRAIINDIVFIDNNKIIGIKERNKNKIVGILYTDSKIKYGSIKDKSLFLFKPTNKDYPYFYVPYKKNIFNKIYCIIEFKDWKTTDKLPIGNLIEVIGNIGDKNTEFEHLRYYYEIVNNTWKIDNFKKKNDMKTIEKIQNEKEDYLIFSIDPIGSKDIDDAFHFNKINDNLYEIGIHIASPSIFFEENLIDIMNRVSTVYSPERKYNMLPNIYADEFISLLEGEKRYALSLILLFDNENNIKDKTIKQTIVKNYKNYDYDNFDKIYKNNNNLNDFVNFSKHFFKDIKIDSHKLVENWMIYTNKEIANYLINMNLSNIILRKHDYSNIIFENKNIDNSLEKYLKLRCEKSALYEIYDNTLDNNQKHSKLGNEYYTHFTSPIRRAVDFFIHMLIIKKKDIIDKNELYIMINKINTFTKKSRKFDRQSKRLDFLFKIGYSKENILTYGYIINISKNKLTLYIPEYNLEEKIIIIPKKFENICNIETNYDDNNIIQSIEYKIDNENKSYTLYEKLNIKLWIFLSFENIFDKLKIEIIPNII